MTKCNLLVFVIIVLSRASEYGALSKEGESVPRILIDNDAGGDDAMAIFLALLYEKNFNGPKVVGLTTTNGNVDEAKVYLNNQRILRVANRQDVPIYRGAHKSLLTTPMTGGYYGIDGLGDHDEDLNNLVAANKTLAVMAMIELSKLYDGELTIVTLGPVTNVALAITLDPGFLGRLNHLYVAAGHVNGASFPTAEFNAHMDVEAYHIVAENGNPDKVTMVPFSQIITSLNISKDWRVNVLGAIQSEIMVAQNFYEKVSLKRNPHTWASLDPAAVAVAIKEDLIEYRKFSKNDILTCGEKKRGINTNVFVDIEDANVRVVYEVNMENYKKFLLEVFSSEKDNNGNVIDERIILPDSRIEKGHHS